MTTGTPKPKRKNSLDYQYLKKYLDAKDIGTAYLCLDLLPPSPPSVSSSATTPP
jgi:hypothetical protein